MGSASDWKAIYIETVNLKSSILLCKWIETADAFFMTFCTWIDIIEVATNICPQL